MHTIQNKEAQLFKKAEENRGFKMKKIQTNISELLY